MAAHTLIKLKGCSCTTEPDIWKTVKCSLTLMERDRHTSQNMTEDIWYVCNQYILPASKLHKHCGFCTLEDGDAEPDLVIAMIQEANLCDG